MADGQGDGSIAPRRGLSGPLSGPPILPPPPPELAEEEKEANRRAEAEKQAAWEKEQAQKAKEQAQRAQTENSQVRAREKAEEKARARAERSARKTRPAPAAKPAGAPAGRPKGGPRRTRRAQLRLVQVDAWSVMKTSFLLSIALGIVLVVAVAIIWAVLGAAGVWESINSIVQQAIGGEGDPFDIQEYAGTSRVLGFTMIVAVIDVILITAISTLGAFLYNLSAALLGGIEVTLAEDEK